MTANTDQVRAGRARRALAFLLVAGLLALLAHTGFVSMNGGSIFAAFEGETLFSFALPMLLVPAAVALSIAFGPAAWQRARAALLVAAAATILHGIGIGLWIAGWDAASRAYGIVFLAPALIGGMSAMIALALARPFRH